MDTVEMRLGIIFDLWDMENGRCDLKFQIQVAAESPLKMQLSGTRLVGLFLWLNQPLVSLNKALLNLSFCVRLGDGG